MANTHTPLYQIKLERTGTIVCEESKFCTEAKVAARLFAEFIGDAPAEHFVMMALDARRRVIGITEVSVGTLSASLVHPREVFRTAILLNAAAIVIGHNHPSGDCAPSAEDREVTRRLTKAGELLGIPLADHVVLGRGEDGAVKHFSFREGDLL